ncbi:MAG: hypothetical protein ACYC1T_07265 [Sulfuricaulis sp.]
MKNDEIEKLDLNGWPLPDEYLIEIGRISALWVSLENFLGICIGKLAGFDEAMDIKPFILVNHSSFPQKLDMLSALCELLKGEFPRLANHKEVVSKVKSAQASRNRYVHNTIGLDPDTGKMQLAQGSARGKVKASLDTVCIADIRRATIDIDEAFVALFNLVLGVDLPPVWKRKKGEHN